MTVLHVGVQGVWIVSLLVYKLSEYWKLERKLTSLNILLLHDGKQILRCPIMAGLQRINLTFLNPAGFSSKILLCIMNTVAFYNLTSLFKQFQIVFWGQHFLCFSSVYRQCMASSEWWRACSRLTTWWQTPRSKTGTDAWRGRRSTTRAASESGTKETTEHQTRSASKWLNSEIPRKTVTRSIRRQEVLILLWLFQFENGYYCPDWFPAILWV